MRRATTAPIVVCAALDALVVALVAAAGAGWSVVPLLDRVGVGHGPVPVALVCAVLLGVIVWVNVWAGAWAHLAHLAHLWAGLRGPAGLPVLAGRLLVPVRQLRELAAIRQLAMTDELTGAANRRALTAALDERLSHPAPGGPHPGLALVLVDLDHFKEVNDSFGHAAGDELLRAVVCRFAEALMRLATPHLLVRLGGDEFAVVLYEVHDEATAMACGKALQRSLDEPVALDDVSLHVQASMGIALAPDHALDRADLLFTADAAMYVAKSSGDPLCFYSASAVGDRRKRLKVAEDLYVALDQHQLSVEYQPVMTTDGELVGAEALVRWEHPTRGRLSPAEFLEVAERYRLTACIAGRVLDVALADLHRWRLTSPRLRASVNVSARDLANETLVDTVASALLRHQVPASALTIEITETAMMRDPGTARSVMEALSALGVQLSVDDYGTGYTSLEHLLALPISEIKLDRLFSSRLTQEGRSVAIVSSTVDLTHALGLRMVAEGVEDQATLDILRDLGCDLVQGWHLGHPMTGVGFERYIAQLATGEVPPRPPAQAGPRRSTGAVPDQVRDQRRD